MKKVYLVHGWAGNPNNNWFPNTISSLISDGFDAKALILPDPENPNPITWPKALEEQIQNPDNETYLVGHSIGCQTILRYLEQLSSDIKLGGIVLVAPFFDLNHLETEEEKALWQKWKDLPLDLEKIKNHVSKIVCIFSDNDQDVDSESSAKLFKELLDAKIILEHNKGHFADHDGIKELPSVVEAILSF